MSAFILAGCSSATKQVLSPTTSPVSTPATQTNADTTTKYTTADVAKHSTAADCWTIISGNIYNITSYIPDHPGGGNIVTICGKDGTQAFQSVGHSSRASEILANYQIGTLSQ